MLFRSVNTTGSFGGMSPFSGANLLIGGAAIGMVVALKQFLSGGITAEGTLMICLLASEFFIPLRLLGSFFHIAMNGMAASDNIFDFLDLEEPAERINKIEGVGEER